MILDRSSIWLDAVKRQAAIVIFLSDESHGCFQIAQGHQLSKWPCHFSIFLALALVALALMVVQTTLDREALIHERINVSFCPFSHSVPQASGVVFGL